MSDSPQTPEAIAYKLCLYIAGEHPTVPTKNELLDIYAECLNATKGNRIVN